MKNFLMCSCGLLALVALAGCTTPIGVDRVSPRKAYQDFHQNALNSNRCSAEARRVLNRYDLIKAFEKNPDSTLQKLHAFACADDRRDLLYALSELNYLNAERQSRSVKRDIRCQARNSYFASAIYSYLFLVGESRDARPNPFDVRLRTASDLYNRGLAQALIINKNAQVELASGPRQTPPGRVDVKFDYKVERVKLSQLQTFYSADEFIVRGLSTRNRDSGMGAPLIVVTDEVGRFREKRRAAGTVFLRVSGDVRDWSANKLGASLELYSAFDTTNVQVIGRSVPLQTDTTAPIAHGLNNSPIWKLGTAQFLSAEERVKTGIRLTQPYAPGRIPVVFVHGTLSSPVWWAEMWNTLRADPVLRSRYQFWAYNYPSGKPITISAGMLRKELMGEIKLLDPTGKDTALQHMVIIGHSQGGLLAKLTATDTGDKLWRIVSKTNINELSMSPQTRELLLENFFFKPLPCVSRVIFMATPHRGSYQNTRFVQKVIHRFMKFPKDVVSASASLLTVKDTIELPAWLKKGVPSSLTGMSTDNPFMLALADLPVAPGIKANSIIAIKGNAQPPNGADGVVRYSSAHVPYVESEFIVRSGHSCQGNPLAIEEVRRILLEHLKDFP